MQLIDSRERDLSGPEIITIAAKNLDDGSVPLQTVLLVAAKELNLETAEPIQVRNTVFVTHRGKGKNKNKAIGRVYNADTANNFLRNCWKYLSHLQSREITHVSFEVDSEPVLAVFKWLNKKAENLDTQISVMKLDNGDYRGYVLFGKDPIVSEI